MPGTPIIQFRTGSLLDALAIRAGHADAASTSMVAKRDLERYYALLDREMASVPLSEPEWSLLYDACNGTLFEPHTIPLMWAEVDDALSDGLAGKLAGKWQVDGPALVAKLRTLTPGQQWAVVDQIERWWLSPATQR